MDLSHLVVNWWAVPIAMAFVVLIFVMLAGHGAEGGLAGRAHLGWTKWKLISRRVGETQARIVLTVFYFTIMAPFGMIRTHLADPLQLKPSAQGPTWASRQRRQPTLDDARRQF
jgi:hypothetical protein